MKIVLILTIILLKCNCIQKIDFKKIQNYDLDKCNNKDYEKDVIEAQIKYLSLINFFISKEYYVDKQYYQQMESKYEQLQKDSKNDVQELKKFLEKFLDSFKSFPLVGFNQKSLDSLNPNDNRIGQAYTQLLNINNFITLFKRGVDFLQFKTQERYPDFVDDFYNDTNQQDYLFKKLRNNYYQCWKLNYDYDLYKITQSFPYQQVDKLSISAEEVVGINSQQISDSEVYNLQNFEKEVDFENCPEKIHQIQSLHLEFKQLFELSEFKLNYSKESIETFHQFFEQQDSFIIDSQKIKNKISRLQIKDEILQRYQKIKELISDPEVNEVFYQEITESDFFNKWQNQSKKDIPEYSVRGFLLNRYQIYSQMEGYVEIVKFFSLDKQYFQELQLSLESLISYIQEFKYQRDYILKGIKYFERDIKICQQEIKKQNLAKKCQLKLQNIDQKINQYQQAQVLNDFGNQIDNYVNIFNEILDNDLLNTMKDIQYKIKENQVVISERFYYVQLYPTQLNSEDQESVQAYDNLIELQNLIVFISNAFSKAKEFLNFDKKIFSSYKEQFGHVWAGIENEIYLQNYSEEKVEIQLDKLSRDQGQCLENMGFEKSFEDKSHNRDNYYLKKIKFKTKKPQKLIILPNFVDQFEKEDITNYKRLSQECAADIEELVEDIFETLKIIELLKYKEQKQNQFDKLILQMRALKGFLQIKKEKVFLNMKNINADRKLGCFAIIKDQSIDKNLQNLYNLLHEMNDNIGYFFYSYWNSRDMFNIYDSDFDKMNKYQESIDSYLKKQKYQLRDKQTELQELYQEYKECTGQEFLFDLWESYEEQNIYGGICQWNCFDESRTLNKIQLDIKIENKRKKKSTQKLHGWRKKQVKQNKLRANKKMSK